MLSFRSPKLGRELSFVNGAVSLELDGDGDGLRDLTYT
jgi:hypothetical protein